MAPRVLISDKLSPLAKQIFEERGIEVDVKVGLEKEELMEIIGDYDGLAIRSATKPSEKIIGAAKNLKVIGRAGIGVDNVDIKAATAKGVIVMNTPFGNSITTAEHAIAMMMALARNIPEANASTHEGKWEKSKFMGVEVTGKTLGVIGCGNIGSIAASRGIGLKMKVIAFDPFLTAERAVEIGVEKVELDELFGRADFITLHTPLTDKTRNIIDGDAIAKMKEGVRIVNCARGGLVDEQALRDALESGKVAGAAFDVYSEEPAKENVLFNAPNMICTPHLGASTDEAQVNVAVQVAEQMSDYLLTGAITNAINFPSVSAEEAPKLRPYAQLAEQLGLFAGQLIETGLQEIRVEFVGDIGDLNTKTLTAAAVCGVLRPQLADINMVSASVIAQDRGIQVEETRRGSEGAYGQYMRLTVKTERQERSVAGTVFSDGKPRIIQVRGINMEASLDENMLYIENTDKPGFIGALGTVLGEAGVNIANFNLGRDEEAGKALALIGVDQPVDEQALEKTSGLDHVVDAKRLSF